MDINDKIQAASHSGALLEVIKSDGEFMVKKVIKDALERNKIAVIKQQQFVKLPTSTYDIMAIPINDISERNNQLIIKMPYIEGIGGDSISNKGYKVTASNLKVALNTYLLDAIAKSGVKKIDKSIILDKVDEIERNTNLNPQPFTLLATAIAYVRKVCTQDLSLPIGPCHGDLTLSNMKITERNELYLFDFLSSYIESPLQDAAKLNQDMLYGWSFRKENASLRLKGQLFCEAAYPNFIDSLMSLYPYEMTLLEMMTLLRISPYIGDSDSITIDWFNRSLSKMLSKLQG